MVTMTKNRVEAFSDGVIAIVITIMVLEIHPPRTPSIHGLVDLWPVAMSYLLSFAIVAAAWRKHHRLLSAVSRIDGAVIWANLLLLFWLSLIPTATAWVGENRFHPNTLSVYGALLCLCGLSFGLLTASLLRCKMKGEQENGVIALLVCFSGLGLSFVSPWAGYGLYVLAMMVWVFPTRRKVVSK